MSKASLGSIVYDAAKAETKEEKIEILQKNASDPLKQILYYTYSPDRVEFLLPDTRPDFTHVEMNQSESVLYHEARKLKIYVKGGGYDQMNQLRRETHFVSLLQDVMPEDADLLCDMIQQKPIEGLPRSVVKKAFPNLLD